MLPLTRIRPKPLLPLGDATLVDHAVARVRSIAPHVVVNVHAARLEMERHLGATVTWSIEDMPGLGTAGGVAAAARLVPGCDLVVVNGDTWCPGDLASALDGWDRERVRVVVAGPPVLEPRSQIVASFVSAAVAAGLSVEPSGLFEVCWSPAMATGRLDVVGWDGPIIDCATPRDHLLANLAVSGGVSVIDVRASLLWYFLKRFGIEGDAAAKPPQDQQIVLLNRDDVMTALSARQEA